MVLDFWSGVYCQSPFFAFAFLPSLKYFSFTNTSILFMHFIHLDLLLLLFLCISVLSVLNSFYVCAFLRIFVEPLLFSLPAFVPNFFVHCPISFAINYHCFFLSSFHHIEKFFCHIFRLPFSSFLWNDLVCWCH